MRGPEAGGLRRSCSVPGWGWAGAEHGLPCDDGGGPTEFASREIFACSRGDHQAAQVRVDGPQYALEHFPPHCNP